MSNQFLFEKTGSEFDLDGHVTPFILVENGKWVATYTGAATKSWNNNRIDVWYPMINVAIAFPEVIVGSLDLLPWATSSNSIQWTYEKDMFGASCQLTTSAALGSQTITLSLALANDVMWVNGIFNI